MRYTLLLLVMLFCSCGCTPQQVNAFNSFVNGLNAGIASAQRERVVRAYEQSVYAPAPQTVVVIHRDER